jgi:hypothetical protein
MRRSRRQQPRLAAAAAAAKKQRTREALLRLGSPEPDADDHRRHPVDGPTNLEVFQSRGERIKTLCVLLVVTFRPEFEPP